MAELYTISDEFAVRNGLWTGSVYNPWDSTIFYQAAYPSSYTEFLTSQEHVDVRSFRPVSNLIPVPQFPDLDVPPQSQLDTVFQTDLEVKPGTTFSENWRVTGTGIQQEFVEYWDLTTSYSSGDGVEYKGKYYVANTTTQGEFPSTSASWDELFFVGKLDDRGGWYGMRSLADNANIDITFESTIDEYLNISDQDFLSIVFPDYVGFDLATSSVTLYSGKPSDLIPSAVVAFTGRFAGNELRIDLNDFAATNFDLKRVSSIQIHIEDTTPPANNTQITIMAVRAVSTNWVESALDFETRWGTIQQPVTLDGNTYAGTVASDFEFIRGDNSHFDPYPSDGSYTVFFYGGGEVDAEAIDPLKNSIGVILREVKTPGAPGADVGKTSVGATPQNMSADTIYAVHVTSGAAGATNKLYWHIDGGGPGSGDAEFRAQIYSDSGNEPDTLLGESAPVTVTDTATAATIEFVLPTAVTISASTKYWISIHGDAEADSCRLYKDTISAKSREDADTYSNGPPDPWDIGGDTETNDDFTAYFQYSTDNGSAIYTWLQWNDAELRFEAQRKDMVNGVVSGTSLYSEQINTSGLDPTLLHAWTVKLVGKTLNSSVVVVDQHREVLSNIWDLSAIDSDDWTFRNGRVGFTADLVDRDSYVDALVTAPVGYALMRTKIYESRDPVDGARLQAVYSPDSNLFTNLTGADAFRDQTKTVSGKGSIRTLAGLDTNQFIVEDWNETYLDIAIWTPATVTPLNQPRIVLNSGSNEYALRMPPLKGAQWNYLYFELGNFRDFITGLAYSLSILPGEFPDTPLGYYWVDSVTVGRRKVAWGVRANSTAPFIRFRRMANQTNGAVHFNPIQRGRQLQLEAQALTPDAWISEFTLFPHYAELGLPVYDQGFEID